MSEILVACKDLIVDAKNGCAKMVFKDICIDILAKARLILSAEEFEELASFISDRLSEERIHISGRRVKEYSKPLF